MSEPMYDAVIIGGGPAGLSAALVLGRARKQVVVIDEGRPRNKVTRETHGFLTRDGISPSEFRRIAKEQISVYPSIRFVEDTAAAVTGVDGDFQITTGQGTIYRSKKLLFAVGKKDSPLDINGLADVYGKSAFVCPYCDGWELRDQPLVVISNGAGAFHFAKLIAGWSERYTICTNGPDEWTEEQREELKQHNIPVFNAPIESIESSDGMVEQVVLEDGTRIPCTGIFFAPKLVSGSDLPASIGCEFNEAGSIVVDAYGKTSVPGVYSAGDAATEMYQAIAAASSGSIAAAGLNGELLAERWNR
ncbi:NAD(P)/FAD-dependent oxidoreductase [Paenibacillus glucanolyticus]|jgi:thioredoxin reductase|uniref:NAD(P)/FAD-dependent oxidoreductase n=1 Tax=Paenibacillus TaxID=44249 RepID=UPI0003E23E80|nr:MULTISPECIES: NAD(P)/FAD-dependent oxidoreductase [Paenibacillus]ANA82397.1 pyridine nucleotide-disulfide oxidoreductase [Paenibacillus glucanolyticus]AVV58864.1 NAD(P)/FAD-dependent oxidoreductase [Paenibacillus glucanolyticus]ETT41526.1 FAD-dependent pyridine nucleotide-disulfide oxidoreductase [Paenibacillus sp. FSL R5-808]OMF80211.1 pyridine nucleotide-disulfide oxidoreductase [Paenibacillus glucanolyticus]